MSRERQDLGQLGEKLACDFLRKNGYQIIDQNYRTRGGEIDIVAKDCEMIVFVEVKTRVSTAFGYPEEAIDGRKQHKLAMTAECYLSSHNLYDSDYRIDAVGIEMERDGRLIDLRHEKDVVGW
ncbi:YraN family protein [Candidatus Falkowbacteria bacterium]|nr:YraN family protein [Candidatus Falkowbacteria bacterium]